MTNIRNPKEERSPSRLIPHRPPGDRSFTRVHSSVTEEEGRMVGQVAKEWYGVDVSVLLYFKSIREILRLHAKVFPGKKKAPTVSS